MSYQLAWEPCGVVLHFSEQITIRDILNASIEYEKDAQFDNLRYVIANYLQIEGCDVEPNQIDDIWAVDWGAKQSNGKIKKAIVTTSPKVIALAKRYSSASALAFPVKVFTTEADARAWLNA
ncbi:MAG: hypothetical protein NTV11_08470 [Rhodocyclales bacterium]|nr:hypothetical protein [Rhodocyclales bacterium]